MPGDDENRRRFRGQRLLDRDANHRLAADIGQSLFGPPMRVDFPTASTKAAICRPPQRRSARGCGRVTISISSPPTPMPMMSCARHRQAGKQARQHPVETVFLRRARAARRAEHRAVPMADADQHQIAGIDRHAEMLDRRRPPLRSRSGHRHRAGRRWPRRRTPIPPFRRRLRALYLESSALASADVRAARAFRRRWSHPPSQAAPAIIRKVFSITLSARPASTVDIMPTFFTDIGCNADHRLGLACNFSPAASRRGFPETANGIIFTVAIILPGTFTWFTNESSVASVTA